MNQMLAFGFFVPVVACLWGMRTFGTNSKRMWWRPLIGAVLAYAIAAQSLLIVLGGFSALAQADSAAPAFELCHHDADTPGLPAQAPGQPGCSHCIFCFAGSHHAVIGSRPVFFRRTAVAIVDPPAAADKRCVPRLRAHSIANPRGPPSHA